MTFIGIQLQWTIGNKKTQSLFIMGLLYSQAEEVEVIIPNTQENPSMWLKNVPIQEVVLFQSNSNSSMGVKTTASKSTDNLS